MGNTTHTPHHGKEHQKWSGNQSPQPERPQAQPGTPAPRPEQKMNAPSRERGHGQKHK